MPRRRLLLVSHVFPPQAAGGAPRMGQFARLLPEFGWDVTVITARTSRQGSIDPAARAALGPHVDVIEAWSPSSAMNLRGRTASSGGGKRLLRRTLQRVMRTVMFPDRELPWVPAAIVAGRRALRATRHDAVLASYGPASNFLVGRALATSSGLPLVLDFRDLWATLPLPVFVSAAHRALAHRLEGALVRSAAAVIAVAPAMATHIVEGHGRDASVGVAITNGFDPDDVARAADARTTEASRPFRLVYTGSLHEHYDRRPLWTAIRDLAAAGVITPETFQVEFVGNMGPGEPADAGVSAFVTTRPFVSHSGVFEAFGRADALLLFEAPGYYAEFSYAAKVFDYILTGKPVLALIEAGGNTARLLESLEVAYLATPGDVAGFTAALSRVLATKGAPPRAIDPTVEPLRSFDRRHLVSRLAATLDATVEHPNR